MNICDNGGQLEKERPLEEVVETAYPQNEERPQGPFQLAGWHDECSTVLGRDLAGQELHCAYKREEDSPYCRLCNWKRRNPQTGA